MHSSSLDLSISCCRTVLLVYRAPRQRLVLGLCLRCLCPFDGRETAVGNSVLLAMINSRHVEAAWTF